jgi:hypothetical protein
MIRGFTAEIAKSAEKDKGEGLTTEITENTEKKRKMEPEKKP